jgi:hypothetical protein
MALNPIDALFNTPRLAPGLTPLSLPGSFGAVFDQAMSQTQDKAASAKLAWVRSQYMKQNVLFDMFSNPKSSVLGFGMTDLFGVGGAFGLPSWAYDAQRVLSGDENVRSMMSLYQQAAALANQQMRGSSLGSLGGSYDSLF